MKLTKLSLVAALLIGSSAFAIENTKISGDARLYYGTQDSDEKNAPNMFDEAASYTNFAARLDLTTDLTTGVSAGVGMQVVTTLGVEHNMVDSVWSGAHTIEPSTGASFPDGVGGQQVDSAMWIDEAWLAGTAFDTTLKIGRQALDTPLAFTETWGVDKNTFEAAVLINQSIPGTTLIATYIGKSNGSADDRTSARESGKADILNGGTGTNLNDIGATAAGYVAAEGEFSTFGTDGTYAYGVVNNSWKPLTVQAWYYDMVKFAEAYWLQADLNLAGLLVGAQYTNTELQNGANIGYDPANVSAGERTVGDTGDTTAYSVMIGYEMEDVVTIKAAYSDVDEDGITGVANTATGGLATLGGQSKLYTEMWWNYGVVSASGAESMALSAEATVGPEIDLFAGYYFSENDKGATDTELTEVTLTASKSFGPLDTSLALIFADSEDNGVGGTDVKTTDIQVYLTYNF